jgi:hypothetical protein
VAVHYDDLAGSGVSYEAPQCVAVWNRSQRREAIEHYGVAARRTCIIGAHLATDVLDSRDAPSREEYSRALGIDPRRRLILFALPRNPDGDAYATFRRWNASRAEHREEAVREAAVVVFTASVAAPESLTAIAEPGVVSVAGDELNDYSTARRLHEALAHADAVVTLDADVALEALARERPVLALDIDDRNAPLYGRIRSEVSWPLVARSFDQHADQLAVALGGGAERGGLAAARAFVRTHGNDIEPGYVFTTRVVVEVQKLDPLPLPTRTTVPSTVRLLARLTRTFAAIANEREIAAPGKRLFLITLPSADSLDAYDPFLLEEGDRAVAVFTPQHGDGGDLFDNVASRLPDVAIAGCFRRRRGPWTIVTRSLAALRMFAPLLQSDVVSREASWRRRLAARMLPFGVRSVQTLAGNDRAVVSVRRLLAAVDRAIPPARAARALIDGHRPDAVIALPSLDRISSPEAAAGQAEIIRAAAARGIPTMAALAAADPLFNAAIAQTPAMLFACNEDQKRQLEKLFALDSGRIAVAGLLPLDRYRGGDDFVSDAMFRQLLGLGARPFVLFAASSGILADPDADVRFVSEWLTALRHSADPRLRDVSVLIRPAPQYAAAWATVDFTGLGEVILCPREYEASGELDTTLLGESVLYAAAVVSANPIPLLLAATAGQRAIGVAHRDAYAPRPGLAALAPILVDQAPVGFVTTVEDLNAWLISNIATHDGRRFASNLEAAAVSG